MTTTPAYDLILATAETTRIRGSRSFNVERFMQGMQTLAAGLEAGKVWNQEFLNAKYYIAQGTEHAQSIAADAARERKADGSAKVYSSGDVRHDIGYAFGMNQAAKLSRNLTKKLKGDDLTPAIQQYIAVLDQISAINIWLKQFKAIIVKGRKPNENSKPIDIENIGTCALCNHLQKLDAGQKMVHHGYQMSDYNHSGYRIGSCFGVGYKPYEFSCEGNEAYLVVTKRQLVDAEAGLVNFKANPPATLDTIIRKREGSVFYNETLTYDKGTPTYDNLFANEVAKSENYISFLQFEIETHTDKVANWKLKPLMDGTKVVL